MKSGLRFSDFNGCRDSVFFLLNFSGDSGRLLRLLDFFGVRRSRCCCGRGLGGRVTRCGLCGIRRCCLCRRGGLGLGHRGRHRHLLNVLHILAIDEIHRVRIDDSGMVRLALYFEIVGDKTDRAARILKMGRLEG